MHGGRGHPGNTHALKDGLYSEAVLPGEHGAVEGCRAQTLIDEIVIARLMLRRTAAAISRVEGSADPLAHTQISEVEERQVPSGVVDDHGQPRMRTERRVVRRARDLMRRYLHLSREVRELIVAQADIGGQVDAATVARQVREFLAETDDIFDPPHSNGHDPERRMTADGKASRS